MIKKYILQFLLILILISYIFLIYTNSKPINEIDYASLVFEGILIVMPLTGIFLINKIKDNNYKTFKYLFLGLSFLSISMTTDTLDEIVEISNIHDVIFEGLFEVLGFIFLTLSLHFWTKYNNEINENLNKIATTDYLTGICNRRSFISILHENIKEIEHNNKTLSLILLDIDNFKKINDNYGHDVGDIVLIKISNIIKNSVRSLDIFARYGGEEFVILLPDTQLENAEKIANKLCKLIENDTHMPIDRVTASFGVTQYINNNGLDDFLKNADKAMYEAKRGGKNQVVTLAS